MVPSEPASSTRPTGPWAITTRRIVMGAIFGAMTLAIGTVGFGFIPLPNASGAGTVLHIPTILGAILGGPVVGMFCGAIFGILALLAVPVFGPVVHLPSRILIGLVAWAVYAGLRKARVNVLIASAIAAVAGSLTNSIVTVGTAVLLGMVTPAVALTFVPQAVTELIAAAVLTPIIVVAVEAVPNVRRS
jgi:uncharacterized membrane protein